MRISFTITHIFLTSVIYAQSRYVDEKFAFQVLYSDKVFASDGHRVNILDMVSIEELLTIEEGGALSIVHNSGFPFDFTNDTTIVVGQLNDKISSERGKIKKSRYAKKGQVLPSNIDYLFIKKSSLGRKAKLSAMSFCFDCNTDLEIIYPPPLLDTKLFYYEDLCFTWKATGSENYQVDITTIDGKSKQSFVTKTNSISIDSTQLRSILKGGKSLHVTILDLDSGRSSGTVLFKEFQIDNWEFPYPCNPMSASYALMAGLYQEMLSIESIYEAEKYFVLATKLSDRPFYRDMLNNFRERRKE